MTQPDPSPEQKALEAIAARMCDIPFWIRVDTGKCFAKSPRHPGLWCPPCIATVALAASALSGEGER